MAKQTKIEKTASEKKTLVLPSNFAFERSLIPTDAVLTGVYPSADAKSGARHVPVEVFVKTVLGVDAFYASGDVKKMPSADGNPQRVEAAALPHDCDTLAISWGLTVAQRFVVPHACNEPEFGRRIREFAAKYSESTSLLHLARLYAANIVNARWGYNNRALATAVTVRVEKIHPADGASWEFNALEFSLTSPDLKGNPELRAKIDPLADAIAAALRGGDLLRLRIVGTFTLGKGETVYPSQEFAEASDDKKEVGKILAKTRYEGTQNCATIHEQKIGAAIRTIDVWHEGLFSEDGDSIVRPGWPLVVNPYGQIRSAHAVVRPHTSEKNFYDLLKTTAKGGEIAAGDAHFVIANLIRGGVFAMGKKEKAAAKSADEAAAADEAGAAAESTAA
jgi:CRISPR-associated protein Csy3